MENNFMLNDDLLWDYADGFLSADEKVRVEAFLFQHPEWQERLDTILAEKRAFHALPLEKPRPGFSDRVMAAWATETHAAYSASAKGKDWIIYLISTVLGLFICAAFVVAGMQAAPTNLPVEMPKVPEVNWNLITGNAALQFGLYMILALCSLKFLERYLHQRRALEQLKA
jgi:anti-sigma factor RsiW